MDSNSILSSIKDPSLVKKRRDQIIKGAISLFKQKGFHGTTTREIAQESGFSIGTLYEYIRTKEDVLFLVYEAINDQVHQRLTEVINQKKPSPKNLIAIIDSYFRLMDEMQDEVTILYQEVKSLGPTMKHTVLEKERAKVLMLKQAILNCVSDKTDEAEAELLANNIFVQGHMWGFRRWMLSKHYTIDEYIAIQTRFLFSMLNMAE